MHILNDDDDDNYSNILSGYNVMYPLTIVSIFVNECTEDIPFVIFIIFQCIFQLFQIAVTLLSVVTLNRVVFAEPPPPNGFGNSFSALNLHLQAPHDSHSNSHHEHSFGMQKIKKNTIKIFIYVVETFYASFSIKTKT